MTDAERLEHVRAQLRQDVSPELYREILALWKAHSIAEDARDIPGLIATLTPDCVYELATTGDTWRGHEGAEAFYRGFLGAFPDVKFHLTDIVIGPQGVFEEAIARGTHEGEWAGRAPSGKLEEFRVLILFPWDADARLFRGERIYTF